MIEGREGIWDYRMRDKDFVNTIVVGLLLYYWVPHGFFLLLLLFFFYFRCFYSTLLHFSPFFFLNDKGNNFDNLWKY